METLCPLIQQTLPPLMDTRSTASPGLHPLDATLHQLCKVTLQLLPQQLQASSWLARCRDTTCTRGGL